MTIGEKPGGQLFELSLDFDSSLDFEVFLVGVDEFFVLEALFVVVVFVNSDEVRHDFSGTTVVVVAVFIWVLPEASIDLVTVAIVSVTVLQLFECVRVVTVGGSDDVRHDFSGTSEVVFFVDVCFSPLPSIDTSTVSNVFVTVLQLFECVRVVTVGGSDDVRHDFSGTSEVVFFVDVCFSPLPSIDTSTVSNVFVTVLQLFELFRLLDALDLPDGTAPDGEQLLPPWISFVVVVMSDVCFLPLRSVEIECVTIVFVFVSQLFELFGLLDA